MHRTYWYWVASLLSFISVVLADRATTSTLESRDGVHYYPNYIGRYGGYQYSYLRYPDEAGSVPVKINKCTRSRSTCHVLYE